MRQPVARQLRQRLRCPPATPAPTVLPCSWHVPDVRSLVAPCDEIVLQDRRDPRASCTAPPSGESWHHPPLSAPTRVFVTNTCDVLIVGGGHNGLVCAAYLAAAGLEVIVLERRHVVGGAAVTEEFHPGFRNSVAAYTVSLLHPRIIRELDLATHGLRVVEREIGNF